MTRAQALIDRLRLPVVAAPMFLVSGPALVIASSRAGVLGTFPALNQRSTEGFRAWLDEIEAALGTGGAALPYGVNLIVHKTNPRVEADLKVCVEKRVPVIITSLGAVPDLVKAVHSYGGIVLHDVINMRHAAKAIEAGVDGLVLVSAGAGGHAGLNSPFAFVSEMRQIFDGIIALAGAHHDRPPRRGGDRGRRRRRLYGHALHRDRGGRRARRLQGDDPRIRGSRTSSTRRRSRACTATSCARASCGQGSIPTVRRRP